MARGWQLPGNGWRRARHAAGRTVRRLAAVPALAGVAGWAAHRQPAVIGTVTIAQSTWMAMTVSVSYDRPGPGDTLYVGLDLRRLTGHRLDFAPARGTLPPGRGALTMSTVFHGVLPPPTPIILHLEVTDRTGHVLAQRDCELRLVNARGKDAWAGDFLHASDAASLSWRVASCR